MEKITNVYKSLGTTWIKEQILNENEMTPKPDENENYLHAIQLSDPLYHIQVYSNGYYIYLTKKIVLIQGWRI